MDISNLYKRFCECKCASTDTRTISSDAMFFGLKGPRFDGNTMAENAIAKGARWAVVDDPRYAVNDRCILVPDVLKAMQRLARYHRDRFDFPVLGLTGSNGKTTTKELLIAALEGQLQLAATSGNLNNHIGVPLTILNTNQVSDFLIVEMGTNQPGDILELCNISDPDLGLITNIGDTHLEKLIDRKGVFEEKRALYDYVTKNNGVFFLNLDDPYLASLENGSISQVKFSSAGTSTFKMSTAVIEHDPYLHFKLDWKGQSGEFKTHLVGTFNLQNIAAALVVADHYKLDLSMAATRIQDYRPENMRSQFVQTSCNQIVMDAYNANPSSMKSSLSDFLSDSKNARAPVVILGDMLELGERSDHFHRDVVDMLSKVEGIELYLVGSSFSNVSQSLGVSFVDVDLLKEYLKNHPLRERKIFIKGSRGIGLERILTEL